MKLPIVGIDISQEWFDAEISPLAKGQRFANNESGFKALQKLLKKHKIGTVRICMEATGMYFDGLAAFMHDQGHEVVVVNPQCIKAYSRSELRRAKTDPLDAKLIAQYCGDKYDRLHLWTPPSPLFRSVRDLLRRREQLLEMRSAEKCRLSAGYDSDVVLTSMHAHNDFLSKQVQVLETHIRELIASDDELKRLVALADTVCGIGWITAATLITEVPPALWDGRLAAAYSGLAPRVDQSGKRRGVGCLSRVGNARIRRCLYMPAISAIRADGPFREFYLRLISRGLKKKQALLAVARKMLHVVFAILRSGIPYNLGYKRVFARPV